MSSSEDEDQDVPSMSTADIRFKLQEMERKKALREAAELQKQLDDDPDDAETPLRPRPSLPSQDSYQRVMDQFPHNRPSYTTPPQYADTASTQYAATMYHAGGFPGLAGNSTRAYLPPMVPANHRKQASVVTNYASEPPTKPADKRPASGSLLAATTTSRKRLSDEEKQARQATKDKRISFLTTIAENFTVDKLDHIDVEEERDPKTQEFHRVAKYLTVFRGKEREEKIDLAEMNSQQIRKMAVNCRIKRGGNMNMYECRRHIAMAIDMGTVYTDNTIANPKTTAEERRVNTLMRITNAVFHPDHVERFIALNDPKKRKDYEAASNSNPIKDFWIQISEMVNDAEKNDDLSVVLQSGAEEDPRLNKFVKDGEFNLNDFSAQTFASCQQAMLDLMKAREECVRQMKISGHHSNDLYTYATNTKFTTVRKSTKPLPAQAVYYCHVVCNLHPAVDGKFAAFLDAKLQSDSEVDLTGTAGEEDVSRTGGKKRDFDQLVKAFNESTEKIASVVAVTSRKEVDESGDESKLWDEYYKASTRFIETMQEAEATKDRCKTILGRNLGIRVRKLEKELGIAPDCSVTATVPSEVLAESNDVSSDITGSARKSSTS